ncbi:MAG: hypothetical protein GVY28_09075 [Alphaproteobacteria bacterium]|jgi:hypothetical protein|nr:hypothetical protein [Alphaproteobacteria bacterium]
MTDDIMIPETLLAEQPDADIVREMLADSAGAAGRSSTTATIAGPRCWPCRPDTLGP